MNSAVLFFVFAALSMGFPLHCASNNQPMQVVRSSRDYLIPWVCDTTAFNNTTSEVVEIALLFEPLIHGESISGCVRAEIGPGERFRCSLMSEYVLGGNKKVVCHEFYSTCVYAVDYKDRVRYKSFCLLRADKRKHELALRLAATPLIPPLQAIVKAYEQDASDMDCIDNVRGELLMGPDYIITRPGESGTPTSATTPQVVAPRKFLRITR
jgi:hypothetical protein